METIIPTAIDRDVEGSGVFPIKSKAAVWLKKSTGWPFVAVKTRVMFTLENDPKKSTKVLTDPGKPTSQYCVPAVSRTGAVGTTV